jgi:hypothetical protein
VLEVRENLVAGGLSVDLLIRILRQAGIDRKEWLNG